MGGRKGGCKDPDESAERGLCDLATASTPMLLPVAFHTATVISVTLTMHQSRKFHALRLMFLLLKLGGWLVGREKRTSTPSREAADGPLV